MDNFPQLENGYTRISNELLDAFCRYRIPGELRQILDCIIRKTYGFQKKEDKISGSQMVLMTGISKGNVSRGLSKLITNKIVIRSDNRLRLNKNYAEWVSFKKLSEVITNKKLSKLITQVIRSDNKKLSEVRDTKERKKLLKEISRKRKFACPLGTENHKKCIIFLEDLAKQKNLPHGWINMGKQIGFLHKLLRLKYTFEQIKQEAIELDQSNFMWDKWDLSTIANQIEKKGREVIVDGTSS